MTPYSLLLVNTADRGGGAEAMAMGLLHGYRAQGHPAWLAVGVKRTDDPDVLLITGERMEPGWAGIWGAASDALAPKVGHLRGAGVLRKIVRAVAHPGRVRQHMLGYEPTDYPATASLLSLPPQPPAVLHLHNLHGGYFDLQCLPWLSHQVPTLLTLHDEWLFTGHCAYAYDCNKWQTGCGQCPDLHRYQSIACDASANNWARKKDIAGKSRLYIASPSQWLINQMLQSPIASAVIDARVIPNGIDLSVFHPADRQQARAALGLPPAGPLVLLAANGLCHNPFKDYKTLRQAISIIASQWQDGPLSVIAVGGTAPSESIRNVHIQYVPYQKEPRQLATYYQAADLFLHAAHLDNFPTTILEALACGTPVVATDVGGIPEQITTGETGYLTRAGDADALANATLTLLKRPDIWRFCAEHAATHAAEYFSLQRMTEEYLRWGAELLSHFTASTPGKGEDSL